VRSKEIRKFFSDIGVMNVYKRFNGIDDSKLNRTNKKGSLPIDAIAASEGIFDYIEGCKMLSYAEIVDLDHRSYVIDINFEEYFKDNFSYWNKINKVLLDPSRRSHRESFCEYLEEQLDTNQIENILNRIGPYPSGEELECVDKVITRVLN